MSVPSVFFLRSNNGTGEVYFCVDGHTVTEICLFSSKISFEQYPMEVKWLTIKSGIWAVKEIPAEQFEQAKLTFFQKTGVKVQVVPETLVEKNSTTPVPDPSPVAAPSTPASVIAQALNGVHNGDGFPY